MRKNFILIIIVRNIINLFSNIRKFIISLDCSIKFEMKLITKDIIPNWLKESELYSKITENNDEFEIPDEFYLENDTITCIEDWIKVKNVCDYWNFDYPLSMAIYSARYTEVMKNYYETIDIINAKILKIIMNQKEHNLRVEWGAIWFQYILDHPEKDWNYEVLCGNPNVTWELIQSYPNLLNNWDCISANPNITWDIIQENPNKLWNYRLLSSNPNITWEIVQSNPNIGWNYEMINYQQILI